MGVGMPMGGMGGGMGGFGGGGFGGAPSLGGFGFSVSFAQAESGAKSLHTMSPVQALAAGAAVAAAVAAVILVIRRKARAANPLAAQLI